MIALAGVKPMLKLYPRITDQGKTKAGILMTDEEQYKDFIVNKPILKEN